MSYGPLDLYRTPGSSGSQLRDFSSIIQTCSGNIQRISQASKPGDRAGVRGAYQGQAWVKLPRRGARVGLPHLKTCRAFHSGGGELSSPSLVRPRLPEGPEPQLEGILSLSLRVMPSWCWGQNISPDSPRVGECVCVTSRSVNWFGAVVSRVFSCHRLPHATAPHLFPVWPVCIGSCLLMQTLGLHSAQLWLLGNQQLSIKGSGESVCLGDLKNSSSFNEFGNQIQWLVFEGWDNFRFNKEFTVNISIHVILSFVAKDLHISLYFKLMKLLFSFTIYRLLNKSDIQRNSRTWVSKTWQGWWISEGHCLKTSPPQVQ